MKNYWEGRKLGKHYRGRRQYKEGEEETGEKFITLSALVIAFVICDSCSGNGLFSTRTTYNSVRGSGVTKHPDLLGCTPVALWALIRSGVSYPEAEEIKEFARLSDLQARILDNHRNWNSGELSEEVLKSLRNWSFHVDIEKAGDLAESGINDTISFIQRLQNEFPRLLHPASANSHNIQHNSRPASIQTADLIISTLYNISKQSPISRTSDISQTLSGSCPSWSKALRQAEAKAQEYRESELMTQIVQNVSRRLGFNTLRFEVIRDAYRLCSYDRSFNTSLSSPWCSIFTTSELEAFEYEEDILSYYSSGPGNTNIALIGCDFIKVFLQNFSVHKTNAKVNIQVASDLFIRAALASLGVAAKDAPLTSANFESNRDRLWRNSILSPYTSNIVAVLNECGNSKRPNQLVSLFVNEIPLVFPFCGGQQYCEISNFQKHYSSITNQAFCKKNFC